MSFFPHKMGKRSKKLTSRVQSNNNMGKEGKSKIPCNICLTRVQTQLQSLRGELFALNIQEIPKKKKVPYRIKSRILRTIYYGSLRD